MKKLKEAITMSQTIDRVSELDASLSLERSRLVGLCARITGNVDIAEDLAQETLLEAWRHLDALRDQERFPQWLSGIARNVCLRWMYKHERDAAHITELPSFSEDAASTEFEDWAADDCNLELERKELVELLDKALALLPTETRNLLIERYVRESPIAEVAARLGIQASAAAMRLQRGKLALRRVLSQELGNEAISHDLPVVTLNKWEETNIWCTLCGQHRTLGRITPELGELLLKCPACCSAPKDTLTRNYYPDLLSGVKGYKPALNRLRTWSNSFYRAAIERGEAACINCGRMVALKMEIPRDASTWMKARSEHAFCIDCPSCHSTCYNVLENLTLELPEGLRFLQTHPRIRTLPYEYVEAEGRPAVVTRFESVTNTDLFVVVSALGTYDTLRIYGRKA